MEAKAPLECCVCYKSVGSVVYMTCKCVAVTCEPCASQYGKGCPYCRNARFVSSRMGQDLQGKMQGASGRQRLDLSFVIAPKLNTTARYYQLVDAIDQLQIGVNDPNTYYPKVASVIGKVLDCRVDSLVIISRGSHRPEIVGYATDRRNSIFLMTHDHLETCLVTFSPQ